MKNIVSSIIGKIDETIASYSELGFNSVAGAMNKTAAFLATLAIIFLILNQFLHVHSISAAKFTQLLIKLTLIFVIGYHFTNLNTIISSIQSGMDSITVSLLTTPADSPENNITIHGTLDDIINILAAKTESALSGANWLAGKILSVSMTFLLGILGGAAILVVTYSKIMISMYFCVASLFITCSMFHVTKDYFFRWIQGMITYSLYPIVTATIIGIGFNTVLRQIKNILDFEDTTTVQEFIPIIMIVFIMISLIRFIPVIVSSLSGMIQQVSPLAFLQLSSKAVENTVTTTGVIIEKIRGMLNGNQDQQKETDPYPTYVSQTDMFAQDKRINDIVNQKRK